MARVLFRDIFHRFNKATSYLRCMLFFHPAVCGEKADGQCHLFVGQFERRLAAGGWSTSLGSAADRSRLLHESHLAPPEIRRRRGVTWSGRFLAISSAKFTHVHKHLFEVSCSISRKALNMRTALVISSSVSSNLCSATPPAARGFFSSVITHLLG